LQLVTPNTDGHALFTMMVNIWMFGLFLIIQNL